MFDAAEEEIMDPKGIFQKRLDEGDVKYSPLNKFWNRAANLLVEKGLCEIVPYNHDLNILRRIPENRESWNATLEYAERPKVYGSW